MYSSYRECCPPPWASQNLQISPETSYRSEHWLPLDQLRPHFHYLYRQALSYPPVFSSTPFALENSWIAIVAGFPGFLGRYSNPAALLDQLIRDDDLRMKFLFWSFMPRRFYGSGSDRYPGQYDVISKWIGKRPTARPLRCLDAASGDGANSYRLAKLFLELGCIPGSFEIEGWSLDPLEVWASAFGRFPHDADREAEFRQENSGCFEQGTGSVIRFRCTDILHSDGRELFDLVLCNGLLGGPIIHDRDNLESAVRNLAELLAPGGLLLAADHFHGGWKQKYPQQELRVLFEKHGLKPVAAGEGIGMLAPQAG
jgi:SAM-dependent methyltransferase